MQTTISSTVENTGPALDDLSLGQILACSPGGIILSSCGQKD